MPFKVSWEPTEKAHNQTNTYTNLLYIMCIKSLNHSRQGGSGVLEKNNK